MLSQSKIGRKYFVKLFLLFLFKLLLLRLLLHLFNKQTAHLLLVSLLLVEQELADLVSLHWAVSAALELLCEALSVVELPHPPL